MKTKVVFPVKLTLLAAMLADAAWTIPAVSFTAENTDCGGVPLTTCPTPFDKTLPDAKNMLT